MKYVYNLVANGPGTLGGPMGTEHEGGAHFSKNFEDPLDAKSHAEAWFKKAQKDDKEKETIVWRNGENGSWHSDMRWVLFHITRDVVVPKSKPRKKARRLTERCSFCPKKATVRKVVQGSIGTRIPLCNSCWRKS